MTGEESTKRSMRVRPWDELARSNGDYGPNCVMYGGQVSSAQLLVLLAVGDGRNDSHLGHWGRNLFGRVRTLHLEVEPCGSVGGTEGFHIDVTLFVREEAALCVRQ